MERKRGNKAQMKLSFGMIFSIILIIVFLAFGFYVIKTWLDGRDRDLAALFVHDFGDDVEEAWKSSQSSQEMAYTLPRKVEYVCFVDYDSNEKGENEALYKPLKQVYYEYENLFFYPVGSGQGLDAVEINYIDIEKVTERENPFCIEKIDGKVKITIKKGFQDALVSVER